MEEIITTNFDQFKFTLETPCPICGQREEPVVWENVSESGYVSDWELSELYPEMRNRCPYCESQIKFKTNLSKNELIRWIENSLELINKT